MLSYILSFFIKRYLLKRNPENQGKMISVPPARETVGRLRLHQYVRMNVIRFACVFWFIHLLNRKRNCLKEKIQVIHDCS